MFHHKIFAAGLLSVVACCVGCSGPANEYDSVVTGTVTVQGDLAKSGTVIFHPLAKDGLVATGQIFADGSYSLRTGQGDLTKIDGGTVKSGDYIVTVAVSGPPVAGAAAAEGGPPVPGPSLIAKKYALKDTSDLRQTIVPGPNVVVLDLEPAEPAAADNPAPAEQAAAADDAASQAAANHDAVKQGAVDDASSSGDSASPQQRADEQPPATSEGEKE